MRVWMPVLPQKASGYPDASGPSLPAHQIQVGVRLSSPKDSAMEGIGLHPEQQNCGLEVEIVKDNKRNPVL
jgi:hypothetical protein